METLDASCGIVSAFAAPDLDDGATHAETVEVSSHTTSSGADVISSSKGYASSESGEDGPIITSTVKERYHVIKRRSAPALIQGRTSPAKSAMSDATLVNSSHRGSSLNSRTPLHADDNLVITSSSSSQQDLSSTVWEILCKVNEKVSEYQKLVDQLQADLATERENAQHDRGFARQALGQAEDDIADLEAEISDLKDELESEKEISLDRLDDYHRCDRDATAVIEKVSGYQQLVDRLQADLATERENAQHDRGLARQALGQAEDDIADLEADISDLKDELKSEKEISLDRLDDYHRCDRDATAVITNYQDRIAKLEADLNLEQRKARHNYGKAEEFMGEAESWRDAYFRLGHNPDALWKMLVEELMARGIVFDYVGRMHRVGLRKALLGAEVVEVVEVVDEWVLPAETLYAQEASEGDDHETTMDVITRADDAIVEEQLEGNDSGEASMGQGQVTQEGDITGETTANQEHIAEGDGHFDLGGLVDANCIKEQARKCTNLQSCVPKPLIEVPTGKAVSHYQRHDVCQGIDTANLVMGDQEGVDFLDVEEEDDIEDVAPNCDLADVSDDKESTGRVSHQSENDGADVVKYEIVPWMQSVKESKGRAVNWRSEPKTAAWEIPFQRLLNPQTSSLGLRHALPLPTVGNGRLRPLLWSHREE